MSKQYAEEKRKKNRDYLKTIFLSIRFSHAPKNIFSTHKKNIKTHIEALKIQNFLEGGGEGKTPLTRGGFPLSCSPPPLEPLALDDFPPPDHFLIRGDGPVDISCGCTYM